MRAIKNDAGAFRLESTMDNPAETKAVLTTQGRVLIEQADGTYNEAGDETDWARLNAMSDEEIERISEEDEEGVPLDDEAWEHALQAYPPPRDLVMVPVDRDVLAWLKAQDEAFPSRINKILRAYYDAHRNDAPQ